MQISEGGAIEGTWTAESAEETRCSETVLKVQTGHGSFTESWGRQNWGPMKKKGGEEDP